MKKKIIVGLIIILILLFGGYIGYKRYSLIKEISGRTEQQHEITFLRNNDLCNKETKIDNMGITFNYPFCWGTANLVLNNTGIIIIKFSNLENNLFRINIISSNLYVKNHNLTGNINEYLGTGGSYCESIDSKENKYLKDSYKCVQQLGGYLGLYSTSEMLDESGKPIAFDNGYYGLGSLLNFTKLSKNTIISITMDYGNILFPDTSKKMILDKDISSALVEKYLSGSIDEGFEGTYKGLQTLMETIQVK